MDVTAASKWLFAGEFYVSYASAGLCSECYCEKKMLGESENGADAIRRELHCERREIYRSWARFVIVVAEAMLLWIRQTAEFMFMCHCYTDASRSHLRENRTHRLYCCYGTSCFKTVCRWSCNGRHLVQICSILLSKITIVCTTCTCWQSGDVWVPTCCQDVSVYTSRGPAASITVCAYRLWYDFVRDEIPTKERDKFGGGMQSMERAFRLPILICG